MQPACRVADDHVCSLLPLPRQSRRTRTDAGSAPSCCRIISTCARFDQISSWSAAAARNVSPAHRRTFLPLFAQQIGKLSDRRRLAHAVDADDKNHRRLCGKVERRSAHVHHALKHLAQGELCLLDGLDVPLAHQRPELFHRLFGCLHTEVRENQALFQIVIKLVVQLRGGEDAARWSLPSCSVPASVFQKIPCMLSFMSML